jgi:hypothetical protein
MVRSLFIALLGATTAGAGLLIVAAPAMAADPPTLTGSAPVAAHGPGTVRFTYTIDVAIGLDSAELATDQDSLLPADAGSVTVDGHAVARSQITVSGKNLTIPLGTVATGTHTVKFSARVPAAPSAVTRSSADLSYAQAGVKQTSLHSAALLVDINQPDIQLISDLGEPYPEQPLGTGVQDAVDFTVTNSGFGTPPTTLRITVPKGLDTTFDGPPCCTPTGNPLPPLTCSPNTPGQHECALGPLAHGQAVSLRIIFTASASAIHGTTASLIITATPDQGVDQDPSNNIVTVPIRFTGLAHLTSSATTPTAKLTVGHSTVVTVTVHNSGPQPVHVTIAFVSVDESHFEVTRFDGDTGGDPITPGGVEWIIGTLDPGRTATAYLTVRAISVGSGPIRIDTESTAGDPSLCQQKFCDIRLTLTAIAETSTAAPTTSPFVPGPGLTGDTPRNDSLPTWVILASTGAALALGWLLVARRTRRPARHRT